MKSNLTLSLLFLLIFQLSLQAQHLRDNMILNVPLNGTVLDYSGYNNDGVIIDATSCQDRFGTSEASFCFDGLDDHIEIPDNPEMKPQLPITISMWVNPVEHNTFSNKLFTNDDNPDFYSGISAQLDPFGSGAIVFGYGTGGNSGSGNRRTAFGTTPLPVGTWTHVVGVIKGPQDMDIYVNGVKDSVTYTGTGGALYYSDAPGRIGAYDGNANGDMLYFQGGLDEIKMWNDTLSYEEIQSVFNELLWDMSVISDALDYSGNMIDGTPNNADLTENRFGDISSAWSFDGESSKIEIPHNPMFKPQVPYSLSYWLKVEDVTQTGNLIFANEDNPNFYSGISMRMMHTGEGLITMSYGTGGGSGYQHRRTCVSTTPLESDKWYHIVAICRGQTDMDIYINGVQDSITYSGTGGPTINYADYPGSVGSYVANGAGAITYFKGEMDEFKMWNRAITEEEIEDLYTPGTTTGINDKPYSNISGLEVSPNPASDFLNINNTSGIELEQYQIFSTQGQLMRMGKARSSISIESLQSGVYILKLLSPKQSHAVYFVKS